MMSGAETSERGGATENSKEFKRRIARRENAKNIAVEFKQARVACLVVGYFVEVRYGT